MKANKLLLGIGCMLTIFSCSKTEDMYNPNYNQELGIQVPDGFNWATTKTVKAVINVNDQYNGKFYYDVNIYSESPTSTSKPLAFGRANIKEPFMQDITIPASLTKVYITESLTYADGTVDLFDTKEVAVSDLGSVAFTRTMTRGNGNNGSQATTLNKETDLAGADNWTEIKVTDGSEFQPSIKKNYVIKTDAYFTMKAQSLNHNILYVKPGVHVTIGQRNSGNQVSVGTDSKIYNDGCITVVGDGSTFSVKNDGGFYNNGTLVSPNVDFHSGTGNIVLTANNFINTKKLDISGGAITMDTGSWINADAITMDQGQAGSITFVGTKNISGYNYGALITTKGITQNNNGLTISGNSSAKLLVQCPTQPITLGSNAEYTTDAMEQISIISTDCCPGFGGKKYPYAPITYAMEDQYPAMGDFDLNDVVVKLTPTLIIKSNTSGTTQSVEIKCEILAVGATMKIAGFVVLNGGTPLQLFDDAHAAMGVNSKVFINTDKSGITGQPAAVITKTFENVTLTSDFSPAANLKFYITANGGSPIYSAEDGGINPDNKQIIGGIKVLDYEYKYPLEKTPITEAFNENGHDITTWITSGTQNNTDWYKYPTTGKVY